MKFGKSLRLTKQKKPVKKDNMTQDTSSQNKGASTSIQRLTQKQHSDKKMTLKQRKWLELYLKTGNASDSAFQVYNCKDRESAANIGWENVRKLDYTEFLEAAGITDKLLQEKIMDGLEATRTVSAVNTAKNATADSTDFVDVPDFLARHKYLETALKLKKRLVDRKDITSDGEKMTPVEVLIVEAKQVDE